MTEIYTAKESSNVLIVTSDRHGDTCPLVRQDFDMVHIPVLWKRGRAYRIFSARILDKNYQSTKGVYSVAMLWDQGVKVDVKVGKIISEA